MKVMSVFFFFIVKIPSSFIHSLREFREKARKKELRMLCSTSKSFVFNFYLYTTTHLEHVQTLQNPLAPTLYYCLEHPLSLKFSVLFSRFLHQFFVLLSLSLQCEVKNGISEMEFNCARSRFNRIESNRINDSNASKIKFCLRRINRE